MTTAFAKIAVPKSGTLVLTALRGSKFTDTTKAVDTRTNGVIRKAVKAASRFTGEKGQFLEILVPAGLHLNRILLAGLGKGSEVDRLAMEDLGGSAIKRVSTTGDEALAIAVDAIPGVDFSVPEAAARVAVGARLGNYWFGHYRTKEKPETLPSVKTVTILTDPVAEAKKAFKSMSAVADSVLFARDLVTEPGNVIMPKTLADKARSLAKLGLKVEVLGQARLERLGMGALLGVAQGSDNEPYVVVMQWNGKPRSKKTDLALVGKGVTFDSGGLSLKTSAGMEEMKFDMAGSAAVIGAMRAIAARKAKANVVGVVGLVENMPSAKAQRPGDVVKSMSGQTVEVLNTDAEGRLVLADCLWYTKERFNPGAMVNLATLTGAVIMSLGYHHAGIFSNDDALAEQVTAAGKEAGEPVWRLPLGPDYDKQINSDIADMKNTGGKGGGSITAAQFLKRFVGDVPWVHIDIAGTAWTYTDKPTSPKGASGFGVRLLNRLVAANFE